MRISSFQQMVSVYTKVKLGLDASDLELRNRLLKTHNYSFIIEGGDLEIQNLLKWIDLNLGLVLEDLFYGKIDYDFHFAEFFLNSEIDLKSILEVVPTIYTTYPSKQILKSDGVAIIINYSESDLKAIIF